MKTIQAPHVSEQNLVDLVQSILLISKNDRVVKVEFIPREYITFTRNEIDFKRASEVPVFDRIFSGAKLQSVVARAMTYSELTKSLLEAQSSRRFTVTAYNTAQVIYRFQ